MFRAASVVIASSLACDPAPTSAQSCPSHLLVTTTYPLPGDAAYDCVTIAAGGSLVTNGHTLKVSGRGGLSCDGHLVIDTGSVILGGGGTSTVNGHIFLSSDAARFRIDDEPCTLAGGGSIIGVAPADARIEIAAFQMLTSRIRIEGQVTIISTGLLGTATFRNEGTVAARYVWPWTEAGFVALRSGVTTLLIVKDAPGAIWETRSLRGQLEFDAPGLALTGEFRVLEFGSLEINVPLNTSGRVVYDNGLVIASPLAPFAFGNDGCTSVHVPPPNPIVGTFILHCP